ncbi:hypothetical protein MKX01_027548 [Papaver californicum]|nr:hypothetical protein MKX01_027548 [Papaver californicum]
MIQSHFSRSNIQELCLSYCSKYSDAELSLMFSWFPCLTFASLVSSGITDRGLEALAKSCPSLEFVNLASCCSITDSGISFLVQNCHQFQSLCILSCSSITGGCKLKPKGIDAIVSGGGIEYLDLSTVLYPSGERCMNTEVVMTISKGCPLLKYLSLSNCEEVELEGWEAIGRNCNNLEFLYLTGCRKLCDLGLRALRNGCSKLSELCIGNVNSCSRSAVELFKSRRPNVMFVD